ncbi:hypothetical protein IEU95_12155 [Hoyosella rhizosphaerae]|uniref:DUF732 domain-containing protein n=1 Tax=Hoyosella rhizosphaerae TaxID=1755582 RepID=A0A916U8P3_9ACTN|nr:hypothetical protein [Hoyosella rhizosphaerae]MBN4927587.1 hypothetical protein [Hoyosella rhizosphaerae]GGC63292.1 hypothetical protein GCM10011410_14660 [Hoyosella rhizosphaerae]
MNRRFRTIAASIAVAALLTVPACANGDDASDASETTTNAAAGAVDALIDLAFVSALRGQYPDIAADKTDEELVSGAESVCEDVRDGDDTDDLRDSVRDEFESDGVEIDDARADAILNLIQSAGC